LLTELYSLSLHDALPISLAGDPGQLGLLRCNFRQADPEVLDGLKALFCADVSDDEFRIFLNSLQPDENLDAGGPEHRAQASAFKDRKSTRLNSSHVSISY